METHRLIGRYAPDFEIPGVDGSVHHLSRYLEQFRAVVVIIMCNHCPYVRLYLDRLKQLQAEFAPQGVTLVGINPNDDQQFPEDSFERMKSFASEQQLPFPYLRDVTQDVARSFSAECTPQAFLINQAGVICYSGSIDDNPQSPEAVQQFYLRNALEQALSNTDITLPVTSPIGCSVKWRIA